MPRKLESIGEKWGAAYVESLPDAKEGYAEELPNLAAKVIAGARNEANIDKYKTVVKSDHYANRVNAGLVVGKADVAYNERMDQIIVTGPTESQKQKQIDQTRLRRALRDKITSVLGGLGTSSGDLAFNVAVGSAMQRVVLMQAMNKFSTRFTPTSTAAEIIAVLKANVELLPELKVIP